MSTEIETQEPKKHAGGRPRKDANDNVPLQQVYEAAVKKALTSSSASERTQALAQAGAMLTPTLGELRVKIKELEDAREAAETALNPLTAERDTLLARVNELQPLADRLPGVEAELSTLKAGNDEWKAAMHKELVSSSQEHEWKAIRAENSAKDTLKEAQAQFGARGQQILLDYIKSIIEQNHVVEPAPETLPAGISPLVLVLWGHTPIKAQLLIAYSKSFPEPSENFKQALLRVLRTGLPQYEGMRPADPIPDIDMKREVLVSMARRWPGVFEEVQRRVDAEQVQRQADFLRTHYADLAAAQHASSLRGEGRTEINVQPQESVTGYQGECIDPEHCACPKHNGLPPHLRVDTWLGTRPTEKIEDINARHEVTEVLSYGNQLIEREAAAKKGKVIKVDVPESMALGEGHSMDDEEGAL